MEALWALLPLCVLLVAALVLFYRYRYRILRDRANAVLSRDRAHVDLQMMVHQVKQVQTEVDGSIASSKSRLPSLPPGPPSSAASETTAPPRTSNAEADRQHYAEVRAPRAAPLMAEQRAPHPTWVEAGRQWFFSETIGVKRSRAAPIAPARLAPATSSGPERVELSELVALAEMADDETVAALQNIVSPGHVGSPAQAAPHFGSMPAQANQQTQQKALAEIASDDETVLALYSTASAAAAAPWRPPWVSGRASTYSHNSSRSSDDPGPSLGNTATPVPPPTRAAPPAEPPAPPAAPPPLPADLAIVRPRHAGSTCSPAQAWHCGSMPPQANQQTQMHAVPVRVQLAKLVELASVDESHETVAAPQAIASPRQPAHCGSMPAQANPQMQTTYIVVPVRTVPVQCGAHLTAAPPSSSIPLQQLSGFGAEASDLRFLFARLFTPKHPSTLPKSQWLSYTRLFSIMQPYAPARVWKQGTGNLKQLVIEWCQHHPAFAGLALGEWCMRLKDDDRPVLPGLRQPTVYKFCLECTS